LLIEKKKKPTAKPKKPGKKEIAKKIYELLISAITTENRLLVPNLSNISTKVFLKKKP
jgi:hypothetical protein